MRKAVVTGCDAKFTDGAAVLLRDMKRYHPDVVRFCITPPADAAAVAARLEGLATVVPAPRPMRAVPERMQQAFHPAGRRRHRGVGGL
jgi:alkanesulfonate monooxygenase SsuD/methylene tetrahydromethanopterin reductase-like flavin-dependent oxidoreductase (luciferase family)